jgi:hypothetical protein
MARSLTLMARSLTLMPRSLLLKVAVVNDCVVRRRLRNLYPPARKLKLILLYVIYRLLNL